MNLHLNVEWWMVAVVLAVGLLIVWLGPPDDDPNLGGDDHGWPWRDR